MLKERPIFGVILLYSLPMLIGGYIQFMVSNYLIKYATDVLILAPSFVGAVFFMSRIWDAINDPIIGWLSDHLKYKNHRRAQLIILSSPFLIISFLFLWISPFQWDSTPILKSFTFISKEAWFSFWIFLLFTALTFLFVPHYSLGAEFYAHEKNRLKMFAGRTLFENLGVVLASVSIALLATLQGAGETFAFFLWFSIPAVFLIAMPLLFIRESSRNSKYKTKSTSLGQSLLIAAQNKALILLIIISFLNQTGASFLLAFSLYFTEYVLEQKSLGSIVPAVFILASSLSIPIWVYLGKKKVRFFWIIGQFLMLLGLSLVYLLPMHLTINIYICAFLIGSGAGAALLYTPTLIARTTNGNEGVSFSLFSFMNKTGMATSALLIGLTLSILGFLPNELQNKNVQDGMQKAFVFFPGFFFFCAMIAILFLKSSTLPTIPRE